MAGKKRTRRAYIDWHELYDTIKDGVEKQLAWKKIASKVNKISTQGKVSQHTMQTWWSKTGKKLTEKPKPKKAMNKPVVKKIVRKAPEAVAKKSTTVRISSISINGNEFKVPQDGLTKKFVLDVATKINKGFATDLESALQFVEN